MKIFAVNVVNFAAVFSVIKSQHSANEAGRFVHNKLKTNDASNAERTFSIVVTALISSMKLTLE